MSWEGEGRQPQVTTNRMTTIKGKSGCLGFNWGAEENSEGEHTESCEGKVKKTQSVRVGGNVAEKHWGQVGPQELTMASLCDHQSP